MIKYTMLFVDDDELLLASLKRMLRSFDEEWGFEFASSAVDGFNIIEAGNIDAIVTDVCMPEIDGMDLLTQVMSKYPSIVRIMMTGMSGYQIQQQAMPFCQFFLWKPVEFSAICTLLQLLTKDVVTTRGAYLLD